MALAPRRGRLRLPDLPGAQQKAYCRAATAQATKMFKQSLTCFAMLRFSGALPASCELGLTMRDIPNAALPKARGRGRSATPML